MKKLSATTRLWVMIGLFLVVITVVFAMGMSRINQNQYLENTEFIGSCILDLNEIEQLQSMEMSSEYSDAESKDKSEVDSETSEDADVVETVGTVDTVDTVSSQEKITALQDKLRQHHNTAADNNRRLFLILYGGSVICLLAAGFYLDYAVLRPFHKMEHFADEIAKGNFDTELRYERHQFFGAFTWAFDSMRQEIVKARSCEKAAIENNKTVIATLSHDIKTPISSIRAYAEAMESNMDTSIERRARYLKVIMRKCDEVTELTNDLFLHSISDLNKLVITREPCRVRQLVEKTLRELGGEQNDITVIGSVQEAVLNIDQKRFVQVIGNIVTNARKYAGDDRIQVWTELSDNYELHIKDHGPGIPEEDMPFIFSKFYRGRNATEQTGAGLGLYIVQYVMKQFDGEVHLNNHSDGLEVVLKFPYHIEKTHSMKEDN